MKAVILAAGRGTRMGRLTNTSPKPLLEIAGKTLLDYKLSTLSNLVEETIVIIGYRGQEIREFVEKRHYKMPVSFLEQHPLYGTAHALWQAHTLLSGRFLVLNGDDIYAGTDIQKCMSAETSMLISYVKDVYKRAAVTLNNYGEAIEVIESCRVHNPGYVNAGAYVLDSAVFEVDWAMRFGALWSTSGLPQVLIALGVPLKTILASFWMPMNEPEDLALAEQCDLSKCL